MPGGRDGGASRGGRTDKVWQPIGDREPPLHRVALARHGVLLPARESKNTVFWWCVPNQ